MVEFNKTEIRLSFLIFASDKHCSMNRAIVNIEYQVQENNSLNWTEQYKNSIIDPYRMTFKKDIPAFCYLVRLINFQLQHVNNSAIFYGYSTRQKNTNFFFFLIRKFNNSYNCFVKIKNILYDKNKYKILISVEVLKKLKVFFLFCFYREFMNDNEFLKSETNPSDDNG